MSDVEGLSGDPVADELRALLIHNADLTAWKHAALARDLHLADLLVSAGYPGGEVGEGVAWVIMELTRSETDVDAIHADREQIRAENAALRRALASKDTELCRAYAGWESCRIELDAAIGRPDDVTHAKVVAPVRFVRSDRS